VALETVRLDLEGLFGHGLGLIQVAGLDQGRGPVQQDAELIVGLDGEGDLFDEGIGRNGFGDEAVRPGLMGEKDFLPGHFGADHDDADPVAVDVLEHLERLDAGALVDASFEEQQKRRTHPLHELVGQGDGIVEAGQFAKRGLDVHAHAGQAVFDETVEALVPGHAQGQPATAEVVDDDALQAFARLFGRDAGHIHHAVVSQTPLF